MSPGLMRRRIADIPGAADVRSFSINDGTSLNAMLFVCGAQVLGAQELIDAATSQMAQGAALLQERRLVASMYTGLAGYGWVLQSKDLRSSIPWAEPALIEIDEALADCVRQNPMISIELISGLAGIMVYAISRGREANLLWIELEAQLTRSLRAVLEGSFIGAATGAFDNAGIAHGVPGLLSVAAVASSRGLVSADVASLVKMAFDGLWAAASSGSDGQVSFPYSYRDGGRARLAWCYGSLGIAIALRNAIKLDYLNAGRLEIVCRSILEQEHDPSNGLNDHSICHGRSGLAVILNSLSRCAQLSPSLSVELHRVALQQFSALLGDKTQGQVDARYFDPVTKMLVRSTSFLEGDAGVCLALNNIAYGKHERWMELLTCYED